MKKTFFCVDLNTLEKDLRMRQNCQTQKKGPNIFSCSALLTVIRVALSTQQICSILEDEKRPVMKQFYNNIDDLD